VATPVAIIVQAPTPQPALLEVTSPTLESSDLAMPNPAVEENETIRAEFVAAVQAARNGRFSEAAQAFRAYAAAHRSSKLTPRALFLAAVMDTDPVKAAEAKATLESTYPTSPYVAELATRPTGQIPDVPDSEEAIAKLEQQLAADPMGPDALSLRRRLGAVYVTRQDYARALATLEPALEVVSGKAEEPEILDLMAEALIATGDNARAMKLLDEIIRRFPAYKDLARVRLNMGLANEALGYYQRAVTEYRIIVKESPTTVAARTAQSRIDDLQKLYFQ
jgi:tetratricopeptide (TPR) repeat protein